MEQDPGEMELQCVCLCLINAMGMKAERNLCTTVNQTEVKQAGIHSRVTGQGLNDELTANTQWTISRTRGD